MKGKSAEYKKAILKGVHDALVQSIKIPDHDRLQRLYELKPNNFEIVKTKGFDTANRRFASSS